MKKYIGVLVVIAVVIIAQGKIYAGSATPSVSVSGTVATTCVVGGTATLPFGSLDANANSGGVTVSLTGMTLWCTKNDSVSFSVNDGQNFYNGTKNMISGAGDKLPYTVSFSTPVSGVGKGDATTMITNLNLRASIAANALDAMPAGAYTDTIIVTITY